jgi:hypothetical protein
MAGDVANLAHRLAREAEAVCRHYLSNGRRVGNYWQVGDARNTSGRSMFVRLKSLDAGGRLGLQEVIKTLKRLDLALVQPLFRVGISRYAAQQLDGGDARAMFDSTTQVSSSAMIWWSKFPSRSDPRCRLVMSQPRHFHSTTRWSTPRLPRNAFRCAGSRSI